MTYKLDVMTTAHAGILIEDIEKCISELYKADDTAPKSIMEKHLPQVIVDYALMGVASNNKEQTTENIREYLSQLKDKLKNMEVMHMDLAFYPRAKFLQEIYEKISIKLGYQVLLDININELMLGGITLEHQGKYFDYSLKTQVNKFVDDYLNHGT